MSKNCFDFFISVTRQDMLAGNVDLIAKIDSFQLQNKKSNGAVVWPGSVPESLKKSMQKHQEAIFQAVLEFLTEHEQIISQANLYREEATKLFQESKKSVDAFCDVEGVLQGKESLFALLKYNLQEPGAKLLETTKEQITQL